MANKQYKLYFDTSDRKKIIVILFLNKKKVSQQASEQHYTSQILLPLIEEILKKEKITFQDIKEIEFNIGPGSYTGLKVGAAVANSLGFLLEIPVNGQINKTVLPVFE